MKIIILGAGQVGSTVARHLAKEEVNDITVVDLREHLLRDLQDRLDINTVCGFASHPAVLRQAGAEDAEMVIAVTDSDETNMIACQVAYTLFHTPTKIARVREADYLNNPQLFKQEALPVDVLISPEQLVTEYINRLIKYPGALQVVDFANGRVRMVGVRAFFGGPLVGHELKTIKKHIPSVETRVAAIYRKGQPIMPEGDTVIEADDEVFFIAARQNIRVVISELRKLDRPVRRVIIAGGGNIGMRLAESLEERNQVKLIERDPMRARHVSERLQHTLVLHGDAADEDLLREESIETTDVFCAVTNDEEANILSAMVAKQMGAKKVMALINRPKYAELAEDGLVDIAISPQQVTIGSLLTHIRRGDVTAVHSLRRGAAEALEAVAHGDRETSRVVGRQISEIELPHGTTIGAVVRGEHVLMAHGDIEIEPDDHLILFLVDKKHVAAVEKLFEVSVAFT
ncbi:MAG: Trk system potassium transporter TrkA [Gammaproteobacteria bacterium]